VRELSLRVKSQGLAPRALPDLWVDRSEVTGP